MPVMLRVAVILWYVIATLAGPTICCWVRCPAPRHALQSQGSMPVGYAADCCCCCHQADSAYEVSQEEATSERTPKSPIRDQCPHCLQLRLEMASALVPTNFSGTDRLAQEALSPLDAILAYEAESRLNAVKGCSEPPLPFPTPYELICVFHIMRC